ncbi:Serine/threonine-protein kinase, active site [Sesbania bispinosa]|nr:Serine/threonine-protein kinase, active site [Sesbania bispinosa]
MIPSLELLSFLPLILFLILKSEANDQLSFLYHDCNEIHGNITRGSNYGNNRDAVFQKIYTDTEIDYGFYNFSYGKDSDKVNAIGLCRGDVKPDVCRSCLYKSAVLLSERCSAQKEAIGYYDNCTLRYSNDSIFGIMETKTSQVYCHLNASAEVDDRFNQTLHSLLDRLKTTAADGDSRLKFAEDSAPVQSSNYNSTIYALLQCTPDLSKEECARCLESSFVNNMFSIPCDVEGGIRYIGPSCSVRYETHAFFDPILIDAPAPQPSQALYPPPSPTTTSSQGKSKTFRTVIAVVIPVVAVAVFLIVFRIYVGARKSRHDYMDGQDDPIKRAILDWEVRSKIIRGIARGLLYLHEDSRLQIIHRDLKTSNILLDAELSPKISDFGMARLFDVNQTQGNTMTIVGTFGYMAPEYIKHGQFSIKSDVFSFGVMILEIVCGRRNSSEIRNGDNVEDLLSFAWKNWSAGTTLNIVDPILKDGSENEIMRCIHIGLLCVQEDLADRPTMSSVLLMLNSSSYPLTQPSEPPFLMQRKRLLYVPSTSSSEQYSEATRSSDSGSQSALGSTNKSSITDLSAR